LVSAPGLPSSPLGAEERALEALDYPRDRLDIKLLAESDDEDTLAAARGCETSLRLELVLVPGEGPRTKPKACNLGLGLARGELVTIYDAEDRPEPLQLRRAVAAFRRLPPTVACLQAKLSYYKMVVTCQLTPFSKYT